MSNTTQPSPENMLSKLERMAQELLNTVPPELKAKISQLLEDGNAQAAAGTEATSTSADECNCPICSLCKLLKAAEQRDEVMYGFGISLDGHLSEQVVLAVGGLKTGVHADREMETTMRTMAGVLISEANYQTADTEDKKILQTSAVDHFTKGIRALNALTAANAAAK